MIFVITNARIDDWEVEHFMASELFDLRRPMRADRAVKYAMYADECFRQLHASGWTTNALVCERLDCDSRRGRELMAHFKADYKDRVELDGKRVMLKSPSSTD